MFHIAKWTGLAMITVALAAPAAHAADKIGYVNLMMVLEGTEEGQDTVAKLKREGAEKEKEFKKRMETLGEKFQRFQSRAKMMKEEKAAEQLRELQQEEQKLKMLAMQFQTDFEQRKAQALSNFQKKVSGVIETVARRQGIQWVVRQEALLYGPPKMDITNEVVREYDKRYRAKQGDKGKKGKKGK